MCTQASAQSGASAKAVHSLELVQQDNYTRCELNSTVHCKTRSCMETASDLCTLLHKRRDVMLELLKSLPGGRRCIAAHCGFRRQLLVCGLDVVPLLRLSIFAGILCSCCCIILGTLPLPLVRRVL